MGIEADQEAVQLVGSEPEVAAMLAASIQVCACVCLFVYVCVCVCLLVVSRPLSWPRFLPSSGDAKFATCSDNATIQDAAALGVYTQQQALEYAGTKVKSGRQAWVRTRRCKADEVRAGGRDLASGRGQN